MPLSDEEISFKLNYLQCLDDDEVVEKLGRIIRNGNKELLESVTALTAQVKSFKDQLAQRDARIDKLEAQVTELSAANDALEQYGRRSSIRISGISETWEDRTTEAVVELANTVLKVDPPLREADIDVSHRLAEPRNAPADQPRPIIVRFMTRTDIFRVISRRGSLKAHNADKDSKIYINEDLTARRAHLFATTRRLMKAKHLDQAWTYNGNIKVKIANGVIKSVNGIHDLAQICPGVDMNHFVTR